MYLISYDISSNRARTRLANKLKDYGKRIQYSVFECNISKERFKKLYEQMEKIVGNLKEGSVRIYMLDTQAQKKTMVIGQEPIDRTEKKEIIFI